MKFGKIIAAAALALAGVAAGASPAAAAPVTAAANASTFLAVSAVGNLQRYRDDNRWGRGDRRWDGRDRRSRGWNRGRYSRSRYHRPQRACWNEWRRGRAVTVCARR